MEQDWIGLRIARRAFDHSSTSGPSRGASKPHRCYTGKWMNLRLSTLCSRIGDAALSRSNDHAGNNGK